MVTSVKCECRRSLCTVLITNNIPWFYIANFPPPHWTKSISCIKMYGRILLIFPFYYSILYSCLKSRSVYSNRGLYGVFFGVIPDCNIKKIPGYTGAIFIHNYAIIVKKHTLSPHHSLNLFFNILQIFLLVALRYSPWHYRISPTLPLPQASSVDTHSHRA